ncbi:MAG: hypothetical protein WB852_07445 [Thermoplasmata archaeon]
MSPREAPWGIHPGLRTRFLTAGERVAWKAMPATPPRPPDRRGRIALLREDEARVEEWGSETDGGLMVDAGPLGALVLMLAVDRRGAPRALGAIHAGRDPAFPAGAIVAVWGDGAVPEDERPRPEDVVDLARYALE